tara:strand:- start:235 stop:702 length:468 start_codon:yes stop_codon:yes gene_type:complete
MLTYTQFNNYLYENDEHEKHDRVLRNLGFKSALHAIDAGLHHETDEILIDNKDNPALVKYVSTKLKSDKLINSHPAGEEHAKEMFLRGASMATGLQPMFAATEEPGSTPFRGSKKNIHLTKYQSDMVGPWSPRATSSEISSNRRETFKRMDRSFS